MKLKAIAILCAAVFGTAQAAATTTEPTAQQQRMKDCNQDATGKKGDERKQFMSRCLKGEAATVGANSQQNKMKVCNTKAANKKGDERKKFMSSCLKG